MNPDKAELLQAELQNLAKAAEYLRFSLQRCGELLSRDAWGDTDLERLESLTRRFARLSDLLTQRILRLIDELELTPEGSMLDRLYRAETRGLLENAAELFVSGSCGI